MIFPKPCAEWGKILWPTWKDDANDLHTDNVCTALYDAEYDSTVPDIIFSPPVFLKLDRACNYYLTSPDENNQ